MQTLKQIREILAAAGLAPQHALGQCFLIDQNLLAKVVQIADVAPGATVVEIGPGTGTLTEELLARAGRVVAVELDRGLGQVLADRYADQAALTLIRGDALAGKHALNGQVLSAAGPVADLVSNLPYNIATPVVALCLSQSWKTRIAGEEGTFFPRLTFTVQREVADRFVCEPGSRAYGPVSVLVATLASATLGPVVPPTAFWPKPKVDSRIVRLDFDEAKAGKLASLAALEGVLGLLFAQRRKQVGALARHTEKRGVLYGLVDALTAEGVELSLRAEQIGPDLWVRLANRLAAQG